MKMNTSLVTSMPTAMLLVRVLEGQVARTHQANQLEVQHLRLRLPTPA